MSKPCSDILIHVPRDDDWYAVTAYVDGRLLVDNGLREEYRWSIEDGVVIFWDGFKKMESQDIDNPTRDKILKALVERILVGEEGIDE